MRKHSKKLVALVGATAAAVAVSGVAYAYFTSTGTGSATATAGTSTAWKVTSDAATVASTLTPGGPVQTVKYYVKNESSGHQGLGKLSVQVAGTVTSPSPAPTPWSISASGAPDCTKGDFELSVDGLTWADAGDAIDDIELAGDFDPDETKDGTFQIRMKNFPTLSQDNCKSATIPLFLSAS